MLTTTDIGVLCEEVHALACKGRVQRVSDGCPGEVVVNIRMPGFTRHLLIAAGDKHARIHFVSTLPKRPQRPSAFVSLLRKHLIGAKIDWVEAVENDRVMVISLTRPRKSEETIDRSSFKLLGELTGRHGNLFLLDAERIILGSLRSNVSHRRKLVVGLPHVLPTPIESGVSSPSSLPTSRDGAASISVEDQSNTQLSVERIEKTRTQAARGLRTARKRLARRLKKIEKDWQRCSEAQELQRRGRLLQSAYGRVAKGASSAVVVDYDDPDMGEVEIPLNPAWTLGVNIQRYFKDGKRYGRAAATVKHRLAETRQKLQDVEQARETLSGLTELSDIETLHTQLLERGLISQAQSPRKRPRKTPIRLPYREFIGIGGQRILVGRGSSDNDHLTFRIARGRDLWLHVDGASGSHVVVVLDKKMEIGGEVLLDAAMLAAHFSSLRNEGVIDVRYTHCKNVRKPKGVGAGRVIVSDAKTIAVRIEKERLQRLFATTT